MNAKDNSPAESKLARLEYNRVVKSVSLHDIRLLSSSFDLEAAYFEILESAKTNDESLELIFASELSLVSYEEDSRVLIGQFDWNAKAEKEENQILNIRATYLIIYDSEEELDEEAARRFVARVGRFATFPYFRTLVGFYSTASSTGLPILPVLKE